MCPPDRFAESDIRVAQEVLGYEATTHNGGEANRSPERVDLRAGWAGSCKLKGADCRTGRPDIRGIGECLIGGGAVMKGGGAIVRAPQGLTRS